MTRETPDQAPEGSQDQLSRREQLVEVSVFLFLILPSILFSFFLFGPWQKHFDFAQFAVSSILDYLALVALIFFFAWRNQEPLARLGWNFRNGWRDVALGIILFFPYIMGIGLLFIIYWKLGFPLPLKPIPQFFIAREGQTLLALCLVCVVAVAEETIFRGYLLLRFRAILGSSRGAILLSSAIFALGHGYKGLAGVIVTFLMGVFYAVLYLRRQSLVSPIVIHFLQDFILVLIPLFGLKIA